MRTLVDADRIRRFMREMLKRGLIDRARLREHFDRIEPRLHRFPAIDPPAFRRAVDAILAGS